MDTDVKRPNPFDAFRIERNIMNFFGFPLEKNRNVFVLMKGTVTLILSFGLIASMIANIIVEIDNVPVILELLYFGLTQTTFLCKIVNFLLRKDEYIKLENFLKKPIFNRFTQAQHVYINEASVMCNIFAKMFRSVVGVTIMFYAIFPFIENTLPLPGWFPFDVNKYHYLLYLYHITALIMNGYVHSSLDCIAAAFICLASAQFEILKNNLMCLRKASDRDLSEEEQDEVMRLRIVNCVDHHNEIIKFVEQIEAMYSNVIFVQFLCSIIIVCVTGFQIFVMPPSRIQYITLILYFFCNLNQLAIYSWFGHDILVKSSGIGEACYMSEWNEYSIKTRKLLFIIMERSKRPVMLTAGKFFNLTLDTLMMILRTSYSYFAVLQQMYKKK